MAASPLCPLMTKVRFSCPACAKAHSDAIRITRKSEQVCHILPLIRNLLLDFKTAAILHAFRCAHISHSLTLSRVKSPSTRRPIGVRSRWSLGSVRFVSSQPSCRLSPTSHPHSFVTHDSLGAS